MYVVLSMCFTLREALCCEQADAEINVYCHLTAALPLNEFQEGWFYFRGSVSNWMLSEPLSVVRDSHGLERTAIFLFKLLVKWALGTAGVDHALSTH